MACTSQTSPCRTRHPEGMGRSRQRPQAPARHGRHGALAANAMKSATCGIGGVSHPSVIIVHNDPNVTCALWIGNGPPSTGGQIPRPRKRLERHTEWPSIVPAGRMDRSRSSISTIRWRQAWKPPISSTAASSMPTMAFSMRVISRRTAAAVPGGWMGRGAVSVLVQFPRIVRARSSGLRAHATPTTSTDKPSCRSASQSFWCRSRHERSAVEVS